MTDFEIIGMLKSYVKNSLKGMGALKGAPCQILSITKTGDVNVVTFKWQDNEGVEHTSTMEVVDGADGAKGDKGDKGDAGGSTVEYTQTLQSGTKIGEISIDGTKTNIFAPSGGGGGSTVVVTPILSSGTKIAEIEVDGTTTNLFAPSGGASEDKYKGHDDGFNDSAQQLIAKIGRGWNLGNTLDGHHQQVEYTRASIVDLNNYFETWYKNFKATKELIHYIKTLGFNSIRLPITWKDHVDYNIIDCEWLKRVEEVVKWVLDEDMYCILNVHHDGIYYAGSTASIVAESNLELPSLAYLNKLWYQIADYFKDYKSKVIFETMNEILDASGSWTNVASESYSVINKLNQSVIDTIRSSGGNNAERFCICPTYGASCSNQALSAYELPTDVANDKLLAEVHYYPTTVSEIAQTFSDINSVLIQNDVPVIMGEYGALWNADAESIVNKIVEQADLYNIPLFYWDNGGTYRIVDRYTLDVDRPALIEAITDEDVDPVDYTYPINIPSMPYYCKMYSADSNSPYGGKYIVICSQYPITDFIPITNDDSGYYQIVRNDYGAMAYFTSDDDITYHVLWSFLDNDRASYMRSKVVLGSTANMEYVEGNYSITGWSDEPILPTIEWTKGEALPSEVTSDSSNYTLGADGITFTAQDTFKLHTNNSANAEFEVTMSVPSAVTTHGGEANMILRANGKHIGSLQFEGGATIYNSSTGQRVNITAGTLYKLKERIENGVGYVYVDDNLLGTVTTLRDTSGDTCDFGGFIGVKVTHFKYTELS